MTSIASEAKFNVILANEMAAITPMQALETPSLAGLRRASAMETSDALVKLLEITNSRFNLAPHKKLNDIQIGFLANSILTQYWRWKIDEVALVLREGIAGKLHTFDHIDEAVVMGWFREYEGTRDALIEAAAHNDRMQHKEGAKGHLRPAGPLYVKQYCATIDAEYLPAYEQYLKDKYPQEPDMAGAVAEYQADLARKVQAEETRLEEQRAKARALVGEYDAATLPTPTLDKAAAQYFAAQRGLPKLSDVLKPTPPPMQVVREAKTDAA